jgi:hypothetical protein
VHRFQPGEDDDVVQVRVSGCVRCLLLGRSGVDGGNDGQRHVIEGLFDSYDRLGVSDSAPLSLDIWPPPPPRWFACTCNCGAESWQVRRQRRFTMAKVDGTTTGGFMTACTQPGCTGMIVDGYCDICGSPAGELSLVPAAASATSPAPAAGPGLTAVRQGAGSPSRPRNMGLTTACTQPGCTGMIVDGYCDICGSLAGAVSFVPAAASATSPTLSDDAGLTGVPAPTPAPAPIDEEMPTPRIPRVRMPRQQSSTQERADPGGADPGAVDAQKVDGEKELAEDETNGAQEYRTRVEEAQLPNDVRKAALCEVGKLELTSDQSPESDEIRIWLDTILDLPWSTETTDWTDIQESREVEATLRKLIEPAVADVGEGDTAEVEAGVADVEVGDTAEVEAGVADVEVGDTAEVEAGVADVEEGDTAEIEAVVADIEKADTAPAGPEHDATGKTPEVPGVLSGGLLQRPQLPEQQVVEPEPVQTPPKKRRFGYLVLAATALAALLIGALLFGASRDRGVTAQSVPTVTATATATVTEPTNEPSNESTGSGREEPTIQLEDLADSAKPFEAVRIQGTYRGGTGTFLRVQRWQGGKWLDFPVPTKTDQSGQFITQAEFGQPGRYRLRVVDPDSGVTSKPFVVVIKG